MLLTEARADVLTDDADDNAPVPLHRRITWSELLRKSFGFDALLCPRCQGRMRLVAVIKDHGVAAKILRHLGLPTDVVDAAPPRAPPQLDFDDASLFN